MMDEELRHTIVCISDEPGSTLTYFMTTSFFYFNIMELRLSLDHVQCRYILLSFYFQMNCHTFEVEVHEDML